MSATGLSVTVTPDLDALTKKLLSADLAGGRKLKNALAKEMRKVGDSIVASERASIAAVTIRGTKGSSSRGAAERQKRGGRGRGAGKGIRGPIANAIKKRNRMTASKSNSAVGVEVRVSKSAMPHGLERVPWWIEKEGAWRHPVFGDRDVWRQQNAHPKGWFVRGYKKAEPEAKAAILAAMHEVEEKFNAL